MYDFRRLVKFNYFYDFIGIIGLSRLLSVKILLGRFFLLKVLGVKFVSKMFGEEESLEKCV